MIHFIPTGFLKICQSSPGRYPFTYCVWKQNRFFSLPFHSNKKTRLEKRLLLTSNHKLFLNCTSIELLPDVQTTHTTYPQQHHKRSLPINCKCRWSENTVFFLQHFLQGAHPHTFLYLFVSLPGTGNQIVEHRSVSVYSGISRKLATTVGVFNYIEAIGLLHHARHRESMNRRFVRHLIKPQTVVESKCSRSSNWTQRRVANEPKIRFRERCCTICVWPTVQLKTFSFLKYDDEVPRSVHEIFKQPCSRNLQTLYELGNEECYTTQNLITISWHMWHPFFSGPNYFWLPKVHFNHFHNKILSAQRNTHNTQI